MSLVVLSVLMTINMTYAQEQQIPDWVKEVAGFWADGFIDNETYVNSLQYLIDHEIIATPTTSQPIDVCYEVGQMNDIRSAAKFGLQVIGQHDKDITQTQLEYLTSLYAILEEQDNTVLETTTLDERSQCSQNQDKDIRVYIPVITSTWIFDSVIDFEKYYTISNDLGVLNEIIEQNPSTPTPKINTKDQIETTIKECTQINDNVSISTKIKNNNPNTVDIEYRLFIIAENDTKIPSRVYNVFNIASNNEIHTRNNIQDINFDWKECGVEILSSIARDAQPPPPPPPPSNKPFNVEVYSCEQSSGSMYIDINGAIENTGNTSYEKVEYITYLADKNEDKIKLEKHTIYGMPIGYTEYIENLIRYSGSWEYCGIKVTGVR